MNQQIKKVYKQMYLNQIDIQQWWDFIATKNKEEVAEVITGMRQVIDRLRSYKEGYHHTTKIRNYCNQYGYTDVHPYEVVRVISPNCVILRALDTIQTKFPQHYEVGGFSAHCVDNHNQEYTYHSNILNPLVKIKKGKKGWGSGKFRMANFPYKHYDYNF